jgi:hypothetical protein
VHVQALRSVHTKYDSNVDQPVYNLTMFTQVHVDRYLADVYCLHGIYPKCLSFGVNRPLLVSNYLEATPLTNTKNTATSVSAGITLVELLGYMGTGLRGMTGSCIVLSY